MQLELGAPLAFLPPKLMADDEYDLWDTLHLQPGASLDEVRVAFRELSRVYHPDKRNGASTERAEGENAAFVRVHRAYRILSDEALRGFYEKYGLSGVRLAESLSDEEGAEGAVSLIDDRLKDDIRGGTSTASLKGLTDASGQAEFAGLLSDVENAFAGVTLQSKFVPEPLEEMKGLELGDADDKDYAISLRMLGAPAGVEHIYRFSASSGKMVEMYFRDFKPTLRGLNRQTMDEVKQPLVLERVQSIALQTRSSFGTPAGYA
eukprot:s2_g5.t1